jgi:2-keto-4-pentenoate hydratase
MNSPDLAARLLTARKLGTLIEEVPVQGAPGSLEEAYAVADRVVAMLERELGPVAGFKVGATSSQGQAALGLSAPFFGRTFKRSIVRASRCSAPAGASIEPEVGFVLARDLPPRSQPYARGEAEAAIGAVVPLLEINAPSYASPFAVGGLCLVADNGVTRALIVGEPARPFVPGETLAREHVRLEKNGVACAEGEASAVLEDPLNALLWLANELRARGRGLHAGDCVASGAMCRHVAIAPGDRVVATYSSIGGVQVEIEASP